MLFVYSKFKKKKWLKLGPEKRLKVLIALEKKIAKKLKIAPLKLEINEDENWGCFGSFSVDENGKKISLNTNLLYEPKYRFHAMETIAHETRHAYQHTIISRDLKWYEFTAKKWRRNWSGYFNSSTDNVMYNNQAIERDAQKYSLKILKQHKYPDEDYIRTYDAVKYRYDQAEVEAKKKYGFFYKHKIEKNIKNRAKYDY
ncbi:MAG: hypothetical protein IKD36_01110 [Clostridia bacterium]|nr:hypothetical protein [Clostridia bacterium]